MVGIGLVWSKWATATSCCRVININLPGIIWLRYVWIQLVILYVFYGCVSVYTAWKHDEYQPFNTLRLRQNGCYFADNIFKCIYLNENLCVLTRISLKFVPKGWYQTSIGSDNGLAPNRWQAIIWTNDGLVYCCLHALLDLSELTNGDEHRMAGRHSIGWDVWLPVSQNRTVFLFHHWSIISNYYHHCIHSSSDAWWHQLISKCKADILVNIYFPYFLQTLQYFENIIIRCLSWNVPEGFV